LLLKPFLLSTHQIFFDSTSGFFSLNQSWKSTFPLSGASRRFHSLE
jgi:hypothetical protein